MISIAENSNILNQIEKVSIKINGLIIVSMVIEVLLLLPIIFVLSHFSINLKLISECLIPMLNSLGIAFVSSIISFILSVIISVLLIKKIKVISDIILSTTNLMLAIPDIVLGIALLSLYGKNGLMGILFGNIFVNTVIGIIIAEVYIMLPYSINLVYSIFRNTNQLFVESAYALGASNWNVLTKIYLKLNRFLLIKTILLNMSYGLSIFGVILIFSYYPKVMTTEIYEKFQLFEYSKAMIFSSYLILVSFLIYFLILIFGLINNNKTGD